MGSPINNSYTLESLGKQFENYPHSSIQGKVKALKKGMVIGGAVLALALLAIGVATATSVIFGIIRSHAGAASGISLSRIFLPMGPCAFLGLVAVCFGHLYPKRKLSQKEVDALLTEEEKAARAYERRLKEDQRHINAIQQQQDANYPQLGLINMQLTSVESHLETIQKIRNDSN